MLLNVGSGGGAAAAPTSGATGGAAADAPAEEAKEEKEEGTLSPNSPSKSCSHTECHQRRRSQTKIWASVSSTKPCVSVLPAFVK